MQMKRMLAPRSGMYAKWVNVWPVGMEGDVGGAILGG